MAGGTPPGVFRWTSGFPITIDNGFTWATNWNIEGDAEPNGPAPVASNPKHAIVNGVDIGPDIFQHPDLAEAAFRPEWPGESGVRNNVIGDGMFDIDTGVSKNFALGEGKRVEFSWQTFNPTNSARYDVRAAQPSLSSDPAEFGKYLSNANPTPLYAVCPALRVLSVWWAGLRRAADCAFLRPLKSYSSHNLISWNVKCCPVAGVRSLPRSSWGR